MNKTELDQSLQFLKTPKGELEVILYAILKSGDEPMKLDIKSDDLPAIRLMFIKSVQDNIIGKNDHVILPLSTADERGKCFYSYDLDIPKELECLENVIGNDNLTTFNFNSDKIGDIDSLIVVLADDDNEISIFKNVTPVEVVGKGGYMLWKSNQRFERFNDQLLRISPKFQVIRVNDEIIILDLAAIEKSFGFHDVITREATLSLTSISTMQIVSNMQSLLDLVSDMSFARKLTRVARSSPVIIHNIPNENILAFSKTHPATKNKMRYTEDNTQFNLDTRVSKDLFIKLLNDDFLTSELTKLYYDSLAKDDIESEIVAVPVILHSDN